MENLCAVIKGKEQFELVTQDFQVNGTPVIKVTHTGICGTDMGWWQEGDFHVGQIPGHEYSGIIVDPGNSRFEVGDRVSGYTQNIANEYCGHCEACLRGDFDHCTNRKVYNWKGGDLSHPGSFAQYTTWFPSSAFKLPENVSNAEGALFEPFAVTLHAINRTNMKLNDKVLVLGGGIIGCSCAEWARAFGAGMVVLSEVAREKFDIIRSFNCCDALVDGGSPNLYEELKDLSGGGFDVIFDCCGYGPAISGAISNAFKPETRDRKCFTSVALAHAPVTVPYNDIVLREVEIKGTKGHFPNEFETVLNFARTGKINLKPYITKQIPFKDIQKGFEELKASHGTPGKALLVMD